MLTNCDPAMMYLGFYGKGLQRKRDQDLHWCRSNLPPTADCWKPEIVVEETSHWSVEGERV